MCFVAPLLSTYTAERYRDEYKGLWSGNLSPNMEGKIGKETTSFSFGFHFDTKRLSFISSLVFGASITVWVQFSDDLVSLNFAPNIK